MSQTLVVTDVKASCSWFKLLLPASARQTTNALPPYFAAQALSLASAAACDPWGEPSYSSPFQAAGHTW